MPKFLPPSKIQEWKGLDRIGLTVHEMNCIYREISKDDVGIDGEIEMVVPGPGGKGYQTTGGILKFQSKSGMSYVKQDTETSFSSPVSKTDLELWYNANFPTVYIVYHPEDDMLYWKEVRSYVKHTRNVWQSPFKIQFNKAKDRFTVDAYDQLIALASVSPPRVIYTLKEQLFSNLLKVRRLPWVWSAPSRIRSYHRIREAIYPLVLPFDLRGDRLYTFVDLNDKASPLAPFCDTAHAKIEKRERWWSDDNLVRLYASLLNQLMQTHIASVGLSYNEEYERIYFPKSDDGALEIKRIWYNVRTKRYSPGRIVVKYYEYGADKFWRHKAVSLWFEYIGKSWYLRIIPKYFFTIDGFIPHNSPKVGSWTTVIKSQEYNPNVLNDILFWSDILSGGDAAQTDLDQMHIDLGGNSVLSIDRLPVIGEAGFSIPSDPATYEEPDPTEQMDLFDWPTFEEDEDEYQD